MMHETSYVTRETARITFPGKPYEILKTRLYQMRIALWCNTSSDAY